ncbi:N-acetyl-gamma-glutamyl-phosphate reductase [Thalassomonas sp. M1454]|uniref:N-acetyl-gamma-glutamyl-phosphate reductase n=1 Tax=Thalassomonas sp. M1454 TaxID=2594477 RepID=UPI00117BE5DE|nr:N-acetyl-gamma-glutamyl-phosphate reductase [Thalassomonas sp. M1454]TRX57866.1 N-acetyl-gamma-glutamyl-phosphate reductase [Thalassomonas sp. M1454]
MKVAVVGASGYAGAELVEILGKHSQINEMHLLVSENSESKGLLFSDLYPRMQSICDLPLQAFSQAWLSANNDLDAVFFATPHEYSQQWAHAFVELGIKVFDLSGAFRLSESSDYPKYYGFEHKHQNLIDEAVYGLAEWNSKEIANAQLVAVPGCYPTASLLGLKPITANDLNVKDGLTVVNGISGVSGAGRKASLATSFNELSLKAYNVLQHRHQPEISQECGQQVIFNPHIAPFKRGLLSTVTMQLKSGVSADDVAQAFHQAYDNTPLVRIAKTWPQIDDVSGSPFASLFWQVDEEKQVVVVSCAIDNLLKGAASQAIQCFNLANGFNVSQGLLGGAQ